MGDKGNPENCEKLISQLITQHGIADFSGDYVFDRVHRLGPRKSNNGDKPRPIICRFTAYKDKEYVLKTVLGSREHMSGYQRTFLRPPYS